MSFGVFRRLLGKLFAENQKGNKLTLSLESVLAATCEIADPGERGMTVKPIETTSAKSMVPPSQLSQSSASLIKPTPGVVPSEPLVITTASFSTSTVSTVTTHPSVSQSQISLRDEDLNANPPPSGDEPNEELEGGDDQTHIDDPDNDGDRSGVDLPAGDGVTDVASVGQPTLPL